LTQIWVETIQHFLECMYVKKRRELADEGPGLLPSVGHKSCNAVLTHDQELSLVSYIRTLAALNYGLIYYI